MASPEGRTFAELQAADNRCLDIFGGCDPMRRLVWDTSNFTAQTDQSRGGRSTARLDQDDNDQTFVMFTGSLDPRALDPPAAFAAMRTVETWIAPNLAAYDALIVDVKESDGKDYTIVVKDTPLERRPDGRLASTVSWEYDFNLRSNLKGSGRMILRFTEFKPFFRGKEMENAPEMKWDNIKSISIMCRSHFGNQEGDFTMHIYSISAYRYRDLSPEPAEDKIIRGPSSRRKRFIQRVRQSFDESFRPKSSSKAVPR
ncbi:complex I intermediate-associated protein 30-domain-containing protein [Immersiella caudata]|uniref:Complex I intermediate-associated protein 30-domain-containing protein n=1 Tax=Immersiella caudata TaxID=314043 RepID=A0AA39WL99_9PEZI|nr:complex I intermediate-associated protein 30-domain-containing protein [Immersiella caudata]